MCGLVGGVSNHLTIGETECIHQLAAMSNFRGDQSTGAIFGQHKRVKKGKVKGPGKSYHAFKRLGNSLNFFEQPKNSNALWSPETFMIAVHTRYATKGAVTVNNAHPFHYGHIIGMHNGTVGAYAPGTDEDGTDSERMIKDIAERSIGSVVEKAKNGAYALVWVNTQHNKLYFIRNKERSLWIMPSTTGNSILWASEKRMLDFVAQSHQHPKWEDPFQLETEVLYCYDLPTVGKPKVTSFRQVPAEHKQTPAKSLDNKGNIVPLVPGGSGPVKKGITDYFDKVKAKEAGKFPELVEEVPEISEEAKLTVQHLFESMNEDADERGVARVDLVEVHHKEFRSNHWVAHVLSNGCSSCDTIVERPDDCNFIRGSASNDWHCDDCATKPGTDNEVVEYLGKPGSSNGTGVPATKGVKVNGNETVH